MQTFCITGNAIDLKPHNGGNGLGISEGVAFSLTTAGRHAVSVPTYQNVVGALCKGVKRVSEVNMSLRISTS